MTGQPAPAASGVRTRRLSRLGAALLVTVVIGCVRVQSGYGLGPENDAATKNVQVGSEVRLVLPEELEWAIEASDTKALSLKTVTVGSIGGSSMRVWSMDVTKAGDFILVATGTPPCQKAIPPCLTPTLHYRFTLHAT